MRWAILPGRRCKAVLEPNKTPYWGRCELTKNHDGSHALERGFDLVYFTTCVADTHYIDEAVEYFNERYKRRSLIEFNKKEGSSMGSLGVMFDSGFHGNDAVCDGNNLSTAAMFEGLPHEVIAWLDDHPEHLHECGEMNTKVWRIFFGVYVSAIEYHEMYKRYCGNPGQLHGGAPGAPPQ